MEKTHRNAHHSHYKLRVKTLHNFGLLENRYIHTYIHT
jgi:hypothetical protein